MLASVRTLAAGPGRHRHQLVERLSVRYAGIRAARHGDRRDGERPQHDRCRPRRRRDADGLDGQRRRGGSRDWRDRAADDAERRRRWSQGCSLDRRRGSPTASSHRAWTAGSPSWHRRRWAVELRNVTAVASGSGSTGLGALSAAGPGGTGAAIDARNVIARGTANGAFGEPGTPSGCGGPCAPGAVTLGYSNVNDPGGVIDTTTVGHNQSADPLLVNPVVGPAQDFHIASPDSPAIGAGTPTRATGRPIATACRTRPAVDRRLRVRRPASRAVGTGQPGGAGGQPAASRNPGGGSAARPRERQRQADDLRTYRRQTGVRGRTRLHPAAAGGLRLPAPSGARCSRSASTSPRR